MKDLDSKLEPICNHITSFLMSQGGSKNGLNTFVDGVVVLDDHRHLKWSTPNSSKLQTSEYVGKGQMLYNSIQDIMIMAHLKEVCIQAVHVENGCFKTIVSTPYEVEVCLWADL